jgi:hypothetical protein
MVENFPLLRFALTRPRRAEALDLAVSPRYYNDDDNDQRESFSDAGAAINLPDGAMIE